MPAPGGAGDRPWRAPPRELIREAVYGLQIPHADSPFGRVTLSLGVAAGYPAGGPEQALDAWVQAADALLYEAKSAGRNRVAGRSGDLADAA